MQKAEDWLGSVRSSCSAEVVPGVVHGGSLGKKARWQARLVYKCPGQYVRAIMRRVDRATHSGARHHKDMPAAPLDVNCTCTCTERAASIPTLSLLKTKQQGEVNLTVESILFCHSATATPIIYRREEGLNYQAARCSSNTIAVGVKMRWSSWCCLGLDILPGETASDRTHVWGHTPPMQCSYSKCTTAEISHYTITPVCK